jgi:hypothetical protein
MVSKYNIDKWLPDGFAIQGEICGVGIQKNRLNLEDHELFIFNVFYIKEQRYLNPFSFIFFNEEYEIPWLYLRTVPLQEWGDSFNFTLEELLEKAKGKYVNTENNREGIVIRSHDQSISFKVINNDYLLKDEE